MEVVVPPMAAVAAMVEEGVPRIQAPSMETAPRITNQSHMVVAVAVVQATTIKVSPQLDRLARWWAPTATSKAPKSWKRKHQSQSKS
jgi:hypothetical protein